MNKWIRYKLNVSHDNNLLNAKIVENETLNIEEYDQKMCLIEIN